VLLLAHVYTPVEISIVVFAIIWLAVGSGLPLIEAIPILLLIVWLMTYDYIPANWFYAHFTGHIPAASLGAAVYYRVFSLRGAGQRLLRRWFPDILTMIAGIVLLTAAGLNWAYHSDSIVLAPGIYIKHSHLNPAPIPLIEFSLGALLIALGRWLDRQHRRKDMLAQRTCDRLSVG
jgi:hypothetical protein